MPYPLPLSDGQVLHVPTSWADVPFGVFCDLLAPLEGEARTLPELLLGLEAGGLNQLALDDVHYLTTLLAFAPDPGPVLELLPTMALPDVGSLPYGCLLLVQQRLASEPLRPPLAHLPYVLAVYRAQVAFGSTDRADALELELRAAPVTECYAEASFFYQACRNWRPGMRPTMPTSSTPKTRSWMRAARPWLRDLGLRFR